MTAAEATTEQLRRAYAETPYPGQAFRDAHPDYMVVRAALAGHAAPAVPGCRVLEIGCATGANLLPMAVTMPDGRFLGIDLAEGQVERGRSLARRAGLTNVEMRCQDLTTFDPAAEGTFDYVVAHGVYSWVPAEVREKLLAICGACLSPNGVAFVSYNTFPGWHLKRAASDLMKMGAEAGATPAERVVKAREMLAFAAMPSAGIGDYKAIVQGASLQAAAMQDWYLAHEELEVVNHPVYFRDFAAAAARHGLRYVTSSAPRTDVYPWLPAAAKERIGRMGRTVEDREQLVDLLVGQTFRRSLLCRADAPAASAVVGAVAVTRLHVAGQTRVEPGPEPGLHTVGGMGTGHRMPVREPRMVAVFAHLTRAWPASVPFAELIGVYAAAAAADPDAVQTLSSNLFVAYQAELVEFWGRETATFIGTARPDRPPRASTLARAQAAEGGPVANLRHDSAPDDGVTRQMLPLLDGTRSPSKLGRDIAGLFATGRLPAGCLDAFGRWSADSVGDVGAIVQRFAEISMLTASGEG